MIITDLNPQNRISLILGVVSGNWRHSDTATLTHTNVTLSTHLCDLMCSCSAGNVDCIEVNG